MAGWGIFKKAGKEGFLPKPNLKHSLHASSFFLLLPWKRLLQNSLFWEGGRTLLLYNEAGEEEMSRGLSSLLLCLRSLSSVGGGGGNRWKRRPSKAACTVLQCVCPLTFSLFSSASHLSSVSLSPLMKMRQAGEKNSHYKWEEGRRRKGHLLLLPYPLVAVVWREALRGREEPVSIQLII